MWRLLVVKRNIPKKTRGSDKLANWIATILLIVQHKLAYYLTKKTATLSRNQLTRVLVAFSVIWSIGSVYYLSKVFTNGKDARPINITHLHRLPISNSHLPIQDRRDIAISEKEYQHIIRFQVYMDSVKLSARHTYDSILCERPALMDSLGFLKSLYNQKK